MLVNALFFVSMGVEATCCPCHSAAHCRHMKRQASLCHCCRRRGRGHRHCDCHCHLHCHCCLHCCHCQLCHSLLPTPSPLAIAVTVAVAHHRRRLFCIAVSHPRCHPPCRWPLPSPSPLAIAVAISIGHHHCCRRCLLPRVVALVWQELCSNNLSKECLPYVILFGQWAAH